MAEKVTKGKAKAEQSVLGTLPASRPERIGRPRREAAAKAGNGAATKRAPAKANGTSAKRAAADANGASTKPATRNGAAAKPRASKPAAIRPASPPLHSARVTDAPPPRPLGAPTGTELVTTTIRAAGELAQIGLTVGGQVLKRTFDRLPRP